MRAQALNSMSETMYRRQLLLRQAVLHRCREDQLKDGLQVRVGALVERAAVADLLGEVHALDLHKLRHHEEGDEVVAEGTGIALGKVDRE